MVLLRFSVSVTSGPICGYIIGSPPQMETMGAPHSSTAARHSSSGMRSVMVDSYSRMRPQPVHVRLQACNGSSISTMGNRLFIMGCGFFSTAVREVMMRNGFEESAAARTSFCHAAGGLRLFFKTYLAIPTVIDKG